LIHCNDDYDDDDGGDGGGGDDDDDVNGDNNKFLSGLEAVMRITILKVVTLV